MGEPGAKHINHTSYAAGIWAGGTTSAIWACPAEALTAPAKAHVWVGTATIDRNAPYSHFPRQERLHIPVQGDGLRLRFRDPAEVVTLERGGQHCFGGERPVEAALVGEPVVAFNLIYRQGVTSTAQVITIGPEPFVWSCERPQPVGGDLVVRVIYVVSGRLAVGIPAHASATLHTADAYVVGPDRVAEPEASVRLTPLDRSAEVVLATLWWPLASAASG